VIVVLCIAFFSGLSAGDAGGQASRDAMKRAETRMLESSILNYTIVQGGEAVGSESVTRKLYSNNTIAFSADITMAPAPGVVWTTEVELVLEEDSHFPRRYEMKKVITHEERSIEHRATVEMFANVAVVHATINESVVSNNIVLPAGTPVFETGILHLVHQLLFWYDRGSGGRQRFTVFDPMRGKSSDFVMLLTGAETIDVMGAPTEVEVFQLEQGQVTARYFVDAEGLLVGADLGYMSYSLSETASGAGKEE
jgi:hypothetical protein